MKKLFLVIVCVTFFSETVHAIGFWSGNGWMQICNKDKGFEDLCDTYTQGIVEGLQFGLSINHFVGKDGEIELKKTEGLFCLRERHSREHIWSAPYCKKKIAV